jgi:cysteine synthase A
MAANELNVYRGPDALRKYFDPDCQPPLPLVEVPEYLNPYHQDGVRIYAKMMSMHPANNVKAMPGERPVRIVIATELTKPQH